LVVGVATASAGLGVLIYGLTRVNCASGYCGDADRPKGGYTLAFLAIEAAAIPLIVIGAQREAVPAVALTPWLAPRSGGLQLQLHL
jgi:hypothetical protein